MEPRQEWTRYTKSPIVEVTCQLHFPDLLTIPASPPAAFQDKVRARYPHFAPTQDRRGYVFSRHDRQEYVTLTQNTLAVTLTAFSEWAEFRAACAGVETAFRTVYGSAVYTRTTLRYRSLFRPQAYGIAPLEWDQLINAAALGPLALPGMTGTLQGSRHDLVLALPDADGTDRFRLVHGFVTVTEPAQGRPSGEPGYLLEQEYFSIDPLQPQQLAPRLDRFNQEAARFFKHCVLEQLHTAMLPLAA